MAHALALAHLRADKTSEFINLGNGSGASVREVIETARRITGRQIVSVERARRQGDPPRLVACADRAARVLGWQPEHSGLDEIIRSAWMWHRAHPHGYREGAL